MDANRRMRSAEQSSTGQRIRRLVGSAARGAGRAVLTRWPPRDGMKEYAACLLLEPNRLTLPRVDLEDLFDEPVPPVQIQRLPRGTWSSPVLDMLTMARLVAAARPLRVLEVGSFRGYTAAAMADHLPLGGTIVAVDIEPEHGEAYRGSPTAERIERRVGTVEETTADEADGSFDLVFVDADHRRASVESDTAAVLRLVADDGWLAWHDYANWGRFTGACGVPEYLHDFARERPAVHLTSTAIAVHRPSWDTAAGAAALERARHATVDRSTGDVWTTEVARP